MKKVFLALGVIATVACFTSCQKTCTCKTYANGVLVNTQEDVEVADGKKCADLDVILVEDDAHLTGTKCR